jgi:hypothetical protein
MTETNLLIRLQPYSVRPDRTPEENFFTECFCHLLILNKKLGWEFVSWLFNNAKRDLDKSLLDNLYIETQNVIHDGK